MDLFLHESIHVILSLTVAYIVWKLYKKPLPAIIGAVSGGLLIDFDHLFDYFLAFGTKLNVSYFLHGYAFLKSDKIYVPLHAWEWVILLVIIVTISKSKILKSILLSCALALFLHLLVDVKVNHVTFLGYSIIYRTENKFELQRLVTADHYKNHVQQKRSLQKLF